MEDFDQCVKKKRGAIPMTAVCASGLTSGIAICLTAPFAGCVIYLSALGVYCGSYFGDCILEIGDSPPTYEYSEAKETEIYNYCQNDNLVTEKLYQVHVECKDDRPPAPENLTVFLTSGEAKDFTCTDCAGQTSTGTIPPPGELVVTECDYGCQIVGEGNDRCLKESETPQAITVDTDIPIGTYKGTTNLGEMYVEYFGGSVTTNELNVTIAEDGTVSGSFTSVYDSGWSDPIAVGEYNCNSQILITDNGTLSGQINGASGTISIHVNMVHRINRNGCPDGAEEKTESNDVTATIEIVGDVLTGSAPDYPMTFEATKQ
jgi:hypothetical protein